MEFILLVSVLICILLVFVSIYLLKKLVCNNTGHCCAKCLKCSKSGNNFICEETGEPVRGLLRSGNNCKLFKGI